MKEKAEITYNPGVGTPSGTEADVSFETASQQLLAMGGVEGVGKAPDPDGGDALVVYVRDRELLSQLPATLNGIKVLVHVTGEIKAL